MTIPERGQVSVEGGAPGGKGYALNASPFIGGELA